MALLPREDAGRWKRKAEPSMPSEASIPVAQVSRTQGFEGRLRSA